MTIRFSVNIPQNINALLEVRADNNGRSKSAEICHILEKSLLPPQFEYLYFARPQMKNEGDSEKWLNELGVRYWRLIFITREGGMIFERVKVESPT